MKTHRIAIAGILAFLFFGAVPSFALQYSITDLGLYSSPDHDFFGGSPLVSYKINNNNQIAGYSSEGAFFWEEGNISNLGNANIGGINDNGAVAGNDLEGIFIWENGVKRYVRSREHVLLDQVVLDINNSNQIALSERPIAERGLYIYAYLWDDMNRTTVRIDNSPYSLDSMATSVNDAGQVTEFLFFNSSQSFLWENGVLTELSTLGGYRNWAWDINNRGQITGSAETADGLYHAALWEDSVIYDMGGLEGYADTSAWAINESGQAVGSSYPYNDTYIFKLSHNQSHQYVIFR